jgi:hypothetical protein
MTGAAVLEATRTCGCTVSYRERLIVAVARVQSFKHDDAHRVGGHFVSAIESSAVLKVRVFQAQRC